MADTLNIQPVFPQSHQGLGKDYGDSVVGSWDVRNDGDVNGFVRLLLYQIVSGTRVLRIAGPSTSITPGATLNVAFSGLVGDSWDQSSRDYQVAVEGSTDQSVWTEAGAHNVRLTLPTFRVGDPVTFDVLAPDGSDVDLVTAPVEDVLSVGLPGWSVYQVQGQSVNEWRIYEPAHGWLTTPLFNIGDVITFITCAADFSPICQQFTEEILTVTNDAQGNINYTTTDTFGLSTSGFLRCTQKLVLSANTLPPAL